MGNIAAVTGADRGLGLALTAALLEKGWQVFAGQYMPDWPELGELLANYSQQLKIVPLDVASQEAVQETARLIGGDVERVDLLINNAGINAATVRISAAARERRRRWNRRKRPCRRWPISWRNTPIPLPRTDW